MRYIVAVSGGVDSVVLLDLMMRAHQDVVVAHFDHGIRADSPADARFVRALAMRYDVPVETSREELGSSAGEDAARQRRYRFLQQVASTYDGRIVTAHHRDDVVETVALNLARGSRWRGLTGLGHEQIIRPLIEWTKDDIYTYAMRHRLEWREDSTNQSDDYARNRLRRTITKRMTEKQRAAIHQLWCRQHQLRQLIEQESKRFHQPFIDRYFLTHIDQSVAEELLYQMILERTSVSLLSSQLERLLVALKTARPGTVQPISGTWRVKFGTRDATIERVE